MFALETSLSMSRVEDFTILEINNHYKKSSTMAKEIIQSNIVSFHSGWAFWEEVDGKHRKLSNLEQHIFNAFGMTSYQLYQRYANLVFDDCLGLMIGND
jgi:hypothetical protein